MKFIFMGMYEREKEVERGTGNTSKA